MEVNIILKKFKILFQHISENKIVISENYTRKLLKLLEDRNENSSGRLVLQTPGFADLIFTSLRNINNAILPVKIFLIEIVTVLYKNELQFTKLRMQGFQATSCNFCMLSNTNNIPLPNLQLACIKLATVQVTHISGLRIILGRKAWEKILYKNIHQGPKQISSAAYNFIAKLVWKLNELNLESDLLEVLGFFVKPIVSSGYLSTAVIDENTDIAFCDEILTQLNALVAVLIEADNYAPTNKVVSFLKDYFIVDHMVYDIFETSKQQSLLTLINECMFRFVLVVWQRLLYNNEIDEFCNNMAAFHRNYLVYIIKKREVFTVIDFVIQSTIIWSNFEKSHASEFNFPLTFERNGKKVDFSLQIVINLTVPMIKYVTLHRIMNKVSLTDVVEHFIVKLGKTITDYIYSSCYMFGDFLEELGETARKHVTTHTLKEVLRLKGHINATQAGSLFQSLYYLLEVFILRDEAGGLVLHENCMDQDDLRLLHHLLEAIKMLLKEYNIPWYQNLEIVSIQALLLNLLKQNFLMTKQVIQILDLLDICVKKFLSPNMSLLVESKNTQCSTINEIGEVIKLYSQHTDWEVRDSAYNLLNSTTDIAFIKYIPLQKVIKENHLIVLASKVGLIDPEFYPQCTALRCLAAATKIDSIWREVLVDNGHIYLQLVNMLRNHDCGMVRKEAANVLVGVYANQKITPSLQKILYEVMIRAARDDLHWEVQLVALNFWKRTIHTHLTNKGMLDGKFPSVTFSKEKRKIIILDDREIQRQLTSVMNDLSAIGCLAVLLECMNELQNIQVMDRAYSIAKELIEMLGKYKFQVTQSIPMQSTQETSFKEDTNMIIDLSYATNDENRNHVIDCILSVNQCELIINLHDRYSQNQFIEMETEFAHCLQKDLVGPDEFLKTFRSNDYYSIIKNKRDYNAGCTNTLNELLDEILDL